MSATQKQPVKVVGRTDDLRISAVRALIAPQLLLEELPVDAASLASMKRVSLPKLASADRNAARTIG